MVLIKDYKELIVWQKANLLANAVIDLSEKFPKNMSGEIIAKQMMRSATSVPANIAEGFGSRKGNEFISYLHQAKKSVPETDYWLFLSKQRKLISEKQYSDLSEKYLEVSKILNALIKKLKNNSKTNH